MTFKNSSELSEFLCFCYLSLLASPVCLLLHFSVYFLEVETAGIYDKKSQKGSRCSFFLWMSVCSLLLFMVDTLGRQVNKNKNNNNNKDTTVKYKDYRKELKR